VKKNWQEQNVYVNAPKRRTAYTLTVVLHYQKPLTNDKIL